MRGGMREAVVKRISDDASPAALRIFRKFRRLVCVRRVLVSAPARGSARVTARRSRDVSEAADLFKTSTRQNPTPQTFPQLYPNFIYNKKGRALRGEKGRNYDTERTA